MHVVAHVPHYLVFDTILPVLFIHFSLLEFRNLDKLFNACGGSCPSVPYL